MTVHDSSAHLPEQAIIARQDIVTWRTHWRIDKYTGHFTSEAEALAARAVPYESVEGDGNLAMYGGLSVLWQALIGNGTTSAGQLLTYFNNAQAAIGVGDSATAEAATQTDLQAATNKLRKAMDATYPQHTDGTSSGAASITFKSTFGSTDANWAWAEWAVFNSATAATGRMLNRKVAANGTKGAGATWVATVTLTGA